MRRSFCVSGDSRRLKRDLIGVKNLIAKKVSKQNPIKWVSKVEMAFLFLSFIFYLNRQWETEKPWWCNLISFRTVSYWPEINPALSEREMIQIFFKNHCYLGVHCSALCIYFKMLRPLSVVLKNRFSCFNGNGYLSRVTILRTKKLTLTYLSKTKTTFQVSVGLVLKASEHLKVKQLAANKHEN